MAATPQFAAAVGEAILLRFQAYARQAVVSGEGLLPPRKLRIALPKAACSGLGS